MDQGFDHWPGEDGERRFGDVGGHIDGSGCASGADGGVRIAETAEDGGDHLREVRSEGVSMGTRE